MRKLVLSVALLTAMISAQAQGCGSVGKGMIAINLNKIDEAKTHFETAGQEIKDAQAKDQPLEAKCYARYYYGSGHVAWQQSERTPKEDLATRVALLDKAEGYFTQFFSLSYEDGSYKAKVNTDLEAVANRQKNIAVDYYNKGDFKTALSLLEKAIANKAKLGVEHLDLHAFQNASITANASGDYEKAIKYIDILIKNPQLKIDNRVNDQEKNLTRKSNYLLRLGKFDQALQVLDSASQVFPESVSLKREKLKIYSELNDDDSSMDLLEDLTKTVTDDIQFYTMLGRIYTKKGFSDKAYEAYRSAMGIDAKNKYALFGMGAYYVNKSNEYVASLNGVGNSALDNEAKAQTVAKQNKNYDKAIYYFNQYLEVAPGDKQALNALKKVYDAKGDKEKVAEINQQLMAE